ncbi:MAG: TRAP transporter permease [Sedimentibacter saalensis]|uniref:TRAP transporter permease n=1 Tax=Sedimentibacter saalensis TaxID=130788 RepID=UPI002B1E9C40|nr:TRAP transporter permease [Sedimentibacter saalensis]MEA5093517.1 TRAP transporter permease [Sedimentibacter saalensis]
MKKDENKKTEDNCIDSLDELVHEEKEQLDMEAKQLVEKVDTESRVRDYHGPWKNIITILSVLWVVFQLYYTTIGTIEAITFRAIHAAILLVFCFLLYPAATKENRKRSKPSIFDFILICLTLFVFTYFVLNYNRIALTGGFVSDFENIIGLIAIILAFFAAKRATGGLVWLSAIFLAYNFIGRMVPGTLGHGGFSLPRIIGHMFWGSQGIFGSGIGVSATYIFVFIVFGAFLNLSGFSRLANNISLAMVGRSAGGPAKVSVVVSGLMGMINGSAVANVATTGIITIPMMKDTGYKAEFAGAVEAAASTGGQFLPPVMGAVAFLMAEFTGESYSVVAMAAAVPAVLYYFGMLMAVHFEAKKLGLKGIDKENIPNALKVLKNDGHLIAPLISLLGFMGMGYTPLFACVVSIFVTIGASYLRKHTRMGLKTIIKACEDGVRGVISVGVSCVIIGLIVGTVSLTGLGLKFGYIMLRVVGPGELLKAGIMVAIMSIILGMGVPGIAAYVIVTAVAVPVMIQVGSLPIPAHLFCLMYASLSNITPPVAMSVYVASGIAKSDFTKTGILACMVGLSGFLLPFFFLLNPILLLGVAPEGTEILQIAIAIVGAAAGIIFLSAGTQGWYLRKSGYLERIIFIAVGLLMIHPSSGTDIVGAAMAGLITLYQLYMNKNDKKIIFQGEEK